MLAAGVPLVVGMALEKKYFRGNNPWGVIRYLRVVIRETVDTCTPNSVAIFASVRGFIALNPFVRKPCWRSMMQLETFAKVEFR